MGEVNQSSLFVRGVWLPLYHQIVRCFTNAQHTEPLQLGSYPYEAISTNYEGSVLEVDLDAAPPTETTYDITALIKGKRLAIPTYTNAYGLMCLIVSSYRQDSTGGGVFAKETKMQITGPIWGTWTEHENNLTDDATGGNPGFFQLQTPDSYGYIDLPTGSDTWSRNVTFPTTAPDVGAFNPPYSGNAYSTTVMCFWPLRKYSALTWPFFGSFFANPEYPNT